MIYVDDYKSATERQMVERFLANDDNSSIS